jgi:hypothetical protein
VLFKLAVLLVLRVDGRATLADLQGHVSVARRGRVSNDRLLINHIHIAPREDTLKVGPLITATPPCISMLTESKPTSQRDHTVSVHVFQHLNPIMGLKSQVAGVRRSIGVERGSDRQHRWGLRIRRRGRAGILVRRRGRLIGGFLIQGGVGKLVGGR